MVGSVLRCVLCFGVLSFLWLCGGIICGIFYGCLVVFCVVCGLVWCGMVVYECLVALVCEGVWCIMGCGGLF